LLLLSEDSLEDVVLHDIVEANRWEMASLHDIVVALGIIEANKW
jgi:hypothetical protein